MPSVVKLSRSNVNAHVHVTESERCFELSSARVSVARYVAGTYSPLNVAETFTRERVPD